MPSRNIYNSDGHKGLASILMPCPPNILDKVIYIEGDCSKKNINECNTYNIDRSHNNIDPTGGTDGRSSFCCSKFYLWIEISCFYREQKQIGEDRIDNTEAAGNEDIGYYFHTQKSLQIVDN